MFDWMHVVGGYKRTRDSMKDFLLSEKSREFFIFLFFFLVSGAFWLLQTLNGDFEYEYTIPLRLRGVPEQTVITSDFPKELKVRVKDKGTVLINYRLGRIFTPVTIDFALNKGKENRVRILMSQLERQLTSQFSASTRILSVKPDTLEYYYAPAVSKRVPVKVQGTLSAAKTYFLADTIFTPDSVAVYAPAAVLDTITAAYTDLLHLTGVSDTLHQEVGLHLLRGVKYEPRTVKMALCPDVYTERTVEVPIEGVNFPADKVLRAFPSKVQVTFQIGKSRYKQVAPEDFHLLVSYEELLRLGNQKYTVKLKSLPEGISYVRYNPSQVDFLIEQVTTEDGD